MQTAMDHGSGLLAVGNGLTGILLALVPLAVLASQGAATARGSAGGDEAAVGILQVSIRVDGLSCPFCAYGLEKKLRRVEHVTALKISMDQGLAELQTEPGSAIDLRALQQAVRDGGFTPRSIHLQARGRLIRYQGSLALALPGGSVLLLVDGPQTRDLAAATGSSPEQGNEAIVQVSGRVKLAEGPGGTDTYLLTLEPVPTGG